jgi:hypothetical protein
MKRFKSAQQAQRFLSVHDQVANLFHVPYPEKASALMIVALCVTSLHGLAQRLRDPCRHPAHPP